MRTFKMLRLRTQDNQSGFTILELMIATMVFSVILLVVAAGILSFTKQYVRGITASNTQAVARAVTADVVQNIQFSSGKVVLGSNVVTGQKWACVGNVAYYYIRGQKVTGTQHGVVKDIGSCSPTGINFNSLNAATQHEMLNQNMRIAEFDVAQPSSSSNSATVTVTVVSGDYDMITDKNGTALSSEAVAPSASFDWGSVQCKLGSGSQFCSVSRLTTYVQGRIGS